MQCCYGSKTKEFYDSIAIDLGFGLTDPLLC
jgi:hypothetical protein